MTAYRSTLFIPCANPRAMAKAHSLTCDALIFDLEDAVGDTERQEAVTALVTKLDAGGFAAGQVLVRLHPGHAADILHALRSVMQAGRVDGLVIPKVGNADDVARIHGILPAPVGLWAMIETARGVVGLGEIAGLATHLPLKGLIAGPNDLRKDLRTQAMESRQDILFVLSQIVVHARAYGLVALDGVYNQYTDDTGFTAECAQGRSLGFDGKTLIHPTQIDAAKAAFSPSAEDIAWAEAVVTAFDGSDAGVVSVNGEMVERLHLEQARTILSFRA